MEKRTTLLAAWALLALAIRLEAQTIFAHRGNSNPVAENWTAGPPGPGTSAGPVSNDLGLRVDAWNVLDTSSVAFSTLGYRGTPSAGQVAQAAASGWRLSAVVRVVSVPATPDYAIVVAYSDGAAAFEMAFGAAPNGDPTVVLATGWDAANLMVEGTSYALRGGGGTYHRFDLYFDPEVGAARLLVNGIERISGYRGWSNPSPGALLPRVVWGSGSSPGRGNGNYSLVEWEIGPEPPTSAQEEEPELLRYDASFGSFPTEQGFWLREERRTPPGDRVQPPEMTEGMLHQLPTVGLAYQYWYADTPVDLDFETGAYVLEARLRVIASNYVIEEGVYQKSGYSLNLADRAGRRFLVGFSSDGITINTDAVNHITNGVRFTPFNTTDDFHTYRLVVSDQMGRLFIDEVEFAATPIGQGGMASQTNQLWFGDSNWNGRSDTHLQTIRLAELPDPPCGTQIGGSVFGQIWTKDGSPYCVTNDVFVTDLTIRAGVEVRFAPGLEFEIAGVLRVRGTADEPVTFKPADPAAGWRGMLFRNAQPGSSLTHTIIEGSINSGLRITNTPPAMTNCFIINNRATGEGGGILADMRDVDFIMVDCVVSNNLAGGWGGGARLRAVNSTVTLKRCTIAENGSVARTSAEQYGGGLLAGLSDTHARLEGCDFARNWVVQYGSAIGGGLALSRLDVGQTFTSELIGCRFTGNRTTATAGGGSWYAYGSGVLFWYGHNVMRNCWVTDNTASMTGGQGAAVGAGVYSGYGNLRMESCLVANNRLEGNTRRIAGGIDKYEGDLEAVNCTIVNNHAEGVDHVHSGRATLLNSIVYDNNNGGKQMSDDVQATFSCVQNGWSGNGNIPFSPALCPETYSLLPGSPCIDAGHSGLEYRDGCLGSDGECTPLARGTHRNDMGVYGGPGGCYWTDPGPQPKIRISPDNLIAAEGAVGVVSVLATGEGPLRYQWFLNGEGIPGATNQIHTIPDIRVGEVPLEYEVEVGNAMGRVLSRRVLLLVTPYEVAISLTDDTPPHVQLRISGAAPPAALRIEYLDDFADRQDWYTTYRRNESGRLEIEQLGTAEWSVAERITFQAPEMLWTDPLPADGARRLYRVVLDAPD